MVLGAWLDGIGGATIVEGSLLAGGDGGGGGMEAAKVATVCEPSKLCAVAAAVDVMLERRVRATCWIG